MSSENQINNSFQIKEEFKSREIKKTLYRPPMKKKSPRQYFRSGNPRVFTEEQIMLFKMRNYKGLGGSK